MQRIKGAVLKSRLAFAREHAGEDGLQKLLASLSPGDQAVLKAIITSSWYPFDVGKRLDDAIFGVLGGGDPQFFRRLGIASAEKNLAGIHKTFLTPGDPHAFLSKAPQIYALYYETGRREYRAEGDKAGVLTTHEAETFSAPDCLTVAGWYERALEMCGAKNPQVVEEECRARGGSVCRYRVTWE